MRFATMMLLLMSVTSYKNGICKVVNEFDTIYYNGKDFPTRFDTKQLFDIMLKYTSYDEDEYRISFYTDINQHKYILTFENRPPMPTITISILSLGNTTSKTIHSIDTTKFPYEYPLYQRTNNPVTCLMLAHLCQIIFRNDIGLYEGFDDIIDEIYLKIQKHKNYQLDIITILALSVLIQVKWYNISDVITHCYNKQHTTLENLFRKIYNYTSNLSVMELNLKNNYISYFIVRTKAQLYSIPSIVSDESNIHIVEKIAGAPRDIFNSLIYLLRESVKDQ